MVAFMHTGTRLTAGYRYTTLVGATTFRGPGPDDLLEVGHKDQLLPSRS